MKRFSLAFFAAGASLATMAQSDLSAPNFSYETEKNTPALINMSDGTRHAVVPAKIDRIEFSRIDTLGYEHPDYVSQITYYKNGLSDTIPISTIDSFEFHAPPTVYADGVTVIERDGLWDYVADVHEYTITLMPSTPAKLIPNIGQRLVSLKGEAPFVTGMSGEVTAVTPQADGSTMIECKFVDYTETVRQHVGHYTITPFAVPEEVPGKRPISANIEYDLINWKADLTPSLRGYLKPSKFFNSEIGASGEFSVNVEIKKTLTIDFSYIIDNGYETVDYKQTMTDRLAFGYSGALALDGEIPIITTLRGKPVEVGPFPLGTSPFEWKVEVDVPFRFSADIIGNGEYVFTNTEKTWLYYTSNPNIKTINKSDRKRTSELESNHQSDFNVSIGPRAEISIRNRGYENIFGEIGFKAAFELEAGLRFNGTEIKPYENSEISTYFYDNKAEECRLTAELFAGAGITFKAGVRIFTKDPLTGEETGGVDWMINSDPGLKFEITSFPLWSRYKYPTFIKPQFRKRTKNSPDDLFSYKAHEKLVSKSTLGYQIIDDNANEILDTQYSQELYDGSQGDKSMSFKLKNVSKLIGRKATIYPIVYPGDTPDEAFNRPVLASEGCSLYLTVTPETGEATEITRTEATLNGVIDNYYYLSESDGHECGFLYSTGSVSSSSASVKCKPEQADISAQLSNLEAGKTYRFAAYVKIADEYIIGDVHQFSTPEDHFVDLGLSVKWADKNIGATDETDFGNFYAWGETAPKSSYEWSNYFDYPYDQSGQTAGCRKVTTDIASDPAYDVAASFKDEGRMPTSKEMRELIDNCDWIWTARDNVHGYKVKSKVNGNSIFIPAAGLCDGKTVTNRNTYGGYWTGTVGSSVSKMTAVNAYFTSSAVATQQGNRYVGRSIRAVSDQ